MPLFSVEHLSVSYSRDGQAVPLLNDVGLELEAGSVYDLVGPSGAGKSTLLRACALMMERSSGELYLDGVPSSSFKPSEWRRRVCLVPQQASLVAGTVRDNLRLPWTLKVNAGERPPADEALARMLALAELADVELGRDVSQLSGGQAARVALLRAFATRPPVMLLDEVDAALDDESACAIGRLTKALVDERTTCLRIRHRAADGFASGSFELRDGRLAYADAAIAADGASCAEGFDPADYAALQDLASERPAAVGEGERP
ncbi:hypothetical protein C1878_14125 [Gordonibacter sp. 28C]|nr:hypothetical protein C1878_14125 [Gordonibacter sp. 28C]